MPARTALLLLLAVTPALAATNWADDPDSDAPDFARSRAICRAHRSTGPLPTPIPVPARAPSSEALYYGIGVPADPAAAFGAALRERTHAPDRLLTGDAMLATMYANGIGAPRDLDRAIAFACIAGGAPAEIDGRVNHLAQLRAQSWQGRDFSICDDITSGYAQGFCAAHESALADQERQKRLAALAARWNEADRRAYAALRRAATAYAEARAANEVDLSGTARAAEAIGTRDEAMAAFDTLLGALERGALPSPKSSATAADGALNDAYARVRHAQNPERWGTVTEDGIRTAERAWIAYRDAFLAFARQHSPATDPDTLRALLTEQRTADLEGFTH